MGRRCTVSPRRRTVPPVAAAAAPLKPLAAAGTLNTTTATTNKIAVPSTLTGPQQDCEVLINGHLYDCTNFKHPGGGIIKFNMGKGDATEAFTEFHFRSPKAQKMLRRLPCRVVPARTTPTTKKEERYAKMSNDLAALREKFVLEGWFEPDLLHVSYRLVELVVLHLLGLYLLLCCCSGVAWLPALFILGVAQGRCGWLMHEGGHGSITGNLKIDVRLQEAIYGFGCGMSAGWWRSQHNKHHATPQKLEHDVDLDTLPLVAFNSKIAASLSSPTNSSSRNQLMKMWVKLQKYTFAPITCLLVCSGWQFVLHPRYILRTKKHAEGFWIVLRYIAMFHIILACETDFWTTIAGYLICGVFSSCYIFTNFALSHTHLGVVEADDHSVHWMEYAGTYTININPVAPVNWWMGYLNFQIEHHLFPSMPQCKFVKLSPIIRQLFEANGIKYEVRGFFAAMKDTFDNLGAVAEGV